MTGSSPPPANHHPENAVPPETHAPPAESRLRLLWKRFSLAIQLALALAVAGGVLAYLVFGDKAKSDAGEEQAAVQPDEVVQVAGPGAIRVQPGTPLDEELAITQARSEWLTSPVLPVTGAVLASLRLGSEVAPDAWQFATPDLLTAFSDWQKAVTDIQYQETQLTAIRELNVARIGAQRKVVARMEKLVAAGTDTEKDLAAERTNLIQFEIQGRKDIRDQEEAARLAHRTEATLARQLQQAGLEPTMLRSAAAEGDIVVAEVPERLIGQVKPGMKCEVQFYALPNRSFPGKVSGISPVISKEKRVLNVQFIVDDPEHVLRPGMFAQVGLGTDRRQAVLMPADGVLHVDDRDYALCGGAGGVWRIVEVQIGELHGTEIEVLAGLNGDERVLGKGAILLKPVVVRCLQEANHPATQAAAGRQPPSGREGDKAR